MSSPTGISNPGLIKYIMKNLSASTVSSIFCRISSKMFGFEDYSLKMKPVTGKTGLFEFDGCINNDLISEDSLVRTLEFAKAKDFAILTAYRAEFSKRQNIVRNRKLRTILNSRRLGVH